MTDDIYDPAFVAEVFDRCSPGYRNWSAIASFGLIRRWRRTCAKNLGLDLGFQGSGVDLMAGTGEIWPHLFACYPNIQHVTAVDISKGMHEQAVERLHQANSHRIQHLQANVLELELPEASADFAVSTFGMKTFNSAQHAAFAAFLFRILKPGAPFSLIEAADPVDWGLRPLYRLYLDQMLPMIERFALRGAQDFMMIGQYTRNFRDGSSVTQALQGVGFQVEVTRYVGGSAIGWHGHKPELS